MADSSKIIAQINQDLFDAQQKLVALTTKNKKLSGENKKLKQELASVSRERDFAQSEMMAAKAGGSPNGMASPMGIPISAERTQRKDNFRASMLSKFRAAAAVTAADAQQSPQQSPAPTYPTR